jgi:natural product precursor
MKKINFASANQVLTEKEMKNVLGGSGGYTCDPYAPSCGGTCQTIYGSGFCLRNSGTSLYCACVIY